MRTVVQVAPDGKLVCELIGALWPSEPAWKVRVEFSRTNDFATDELWTMPSMPVPSAHQVLNLGADAEVKGIRLHGAAIGGVGAELPAFAHLAFRGAVNLVVQAQAWNPESA